ncbi:hypothetical protein [Fictibacillus fluitans]|uniref:Tetratricopeptide repeat protein n=1 Tax=Fictibacillus fluitans TaxID=3058422 RepID=A0ABT8HX58_9BACL|nr:hypothetical protein [Fictibacillus sp. NE201]MDN4525361.1 hypothetical protein [Fictibacillus sp. NE201]
MKHELKLMPVEAIKVRNAIVSEIEQTDSPFRKEWLNLIYNKIDFSKGTAQLDGGEMELIVQCLRKIASLYVRNGRMKSAIPYFNIAYKVHDEKLKYQARYGPKVLSFKGGENNESDQQRRQAGVSV